MSLSYSIFASIIKILTKQFAEKFCDATNLHVIEIYFLRSFEAVFLVYYKGRSQFAVVIVFFSIKLLCLIDLLELLVWKKGYTKVYLWSQKGWQIELFVPTIIILLNCCDCVYSNSDTHLTSFQPLPSGLPSSAYPEINLKGLLGKNDVIPKRDENLLKTLCMSRPHVGIKTLLPVVRPTTDSNQGILLINKITL